MSKYYLTTPLYYVNARPHIGHAYTTVAADALARFYRLMGRDVFFLTGTDEHGQKVQKAAVDDGLTPQEFTDKLSGEFRTLWEKLNVRYDDFIRTTEPRHVHAVREVWKALEKNGDIEVQTYEGWYDTVAEEFLTDRDAGTDPAKHLDGTARKIPLERIQEKNYFFKISKYQQWLIDYIEAHPDFILPETRRNETLSFLKNNTLLDLCISRPKARLKWGIETPLSSDHVTYVWFDALINYVSACGYPADPAKLKRYWPADVHLIGKDILRPHTVYWPIMLKALGMECPKLVFAHGWWMVDQAKMSKSLGNVINPYDVIAEYGVDAFRYFMLREVPFGQDGAYSDAAMTLRYNVDLANDLGNLLHRSLSMLGKYFEGVVPANGAAKADNVLRQKSATLVGRVEAQLAVMRFSDALAEIWDLVGAANRFIEDSAPWKLFKENRTEELKVVMTSLCESLRILAQAVWPFIPQSAEKIWVQLGLDPADLTGKSFKETPWNYFVKDTPTQKGDPVFPRRETETSAAQKR